MATRLTKAQQAEKQEAIEKLREYFKPGDTILVILRHVARSGMSRSISVMNDGWDESYLVARALERTIDQNNGGVKCGGAGMDMGFEIIHSLSYALYPEYDCIKTEDRRCPSADHYNSSTRDNPPARHKDGYALSHRWL